MTSSALSGSFIASVSMPTASEKAVRQSSQQKSRLAATGGQMTLTSQTVVAERVCAFLRQQHPTKTADNVSAEAGVPAGTVQKWLDRGSAPSAEHIWRLMGAYGLDFICAGFASTPEWLGRLAREEERRRVREQIEALQARLQGDIA